MFDFQHAFKIVPSKSIYYYY
uniref:Uncharacterized protein n=1 Tax=Lepeophtheirus salmonis TaxID=72036 RepID=A0A0K2UEM0_LEPSM